jgi:hypothetical protein
MDPFGPKYQDQVPPPIFDAEHIIKLQELSGQLFSATLLPLELMIQPGQSKSNPSESIKWQTSLKRL